MLASGLRSIARRVRHAPGLYALDGVWEAIRPLYGRVLDKLSGDRGLEVRIADCSVRLSPRFAGIAWESIEVDSYAAFANAVHPGDVVYDIGAHIGTYAILALRKSAPSGRVVAYEPVDLTRDFLVRHLEWNGAGERAVIRPVCCGSAVGEARLYLQADEMSGESGLLENSNGKSLMVPVRTLDSEIADLSLIPSIIKIDVEGWEFDVLKGAESTLEQYRPLLFVSLHPRALARSGSSPQLVQRWLAERGYICRIVGSDHEIHVVASPSAREPRAAAHPATS